MTFLAGMSVIATSLLTSLVYHRAYDPTPSSFSTIGQLEGWRLLQDLIIAGWLIGAITTIVCVWSTCRFLLRTPGVAEWLLGNPVPLDYGVRPLRFWLCLAAVIIGGATSLYCTAFTLGPNDLPGNAAQRICYREDQSDAGAGCVLGWPTTFFALHQLRRSYRERTR